MKPETSVSNLIIFIVLSVLLHIAAGAALYFFAPEPRSPLPLGAYTVSLVPPEPAPPAPPALPQTTKPRAQKEARPAPPLKKMPPASGPPPTELSARASRPPEAETERGEPSTEKGGGAPSGKKGETVSEKPGYSARPEEEKPEDTGKKEGPAEGEGLGKGLFDKDVLSKVIREGKGNKPADSSVTFDTAGARHWGYMQRLKERIEYVWEYPPEAASKGIYGDLVIRFVIKKDGELGAVELVRTSGWRDLDRAAMRSLKDAAPYWPLPEEWETESLTVTGHFIYSIYGNYYIR
jgi:protein TonB